MVCCIEFLSASVLERSAAPAIPNFPSPPWQIAQLSVYKTWLLIVPSAATASVLTFALFLAEISASQYYSVIINRDKAPSTLFLFLNPIIATGIDKKTKPIFIINRGLISFI